MVREFPYVENVLNGAKYPLNAQVTASALTFSSLPLTVPLGHSLTCQPQIDCTNLEKRSKDKGLVKISTN